MVNTEFAKFSTALEPFSDYDSLRERIHEFKALVGFYGYSIPTS